MKTLRVFASRFSQPLTLSSLALFVAPAALGGDPTPRDPDPWSIARADDSGVVGVTLDDGSAPDSAVWMTDFTAALERAAQERKSVLINFTSDDCWWSRRMAADIFSRREFVEYATQFFVLVKIDFTPHAAQTAWDTAEKDGLARRFKVSGVPTVVVVNSRGAKRAEVGGYVRGGPSALFAELIKQMPRL